MLFSTVINIDTSTSMVHNISTRTLCLLLLLLAFMIKNTLSNIAKSNASNSIITPSITIIIEISFGFLDFWNVGFLDFWILGFWDFRSRCSMPNNCDG